MIFGLLLIPAAARAQADAGVIINPAALQQLAGLTPPVAAPAISTLNPATHKVHRISYRRVFHKRPSATPSPTRIVAKPAIISPSKPTTAPPTTAQPAVMPAVVKPVAAKLAPVPQAAPLPVPATIAISFTAGSSSLPATAVTTLKPLCTHPAAAINIDAYAPADISDPSSAPRLSMTRAFAIRDALVACGVPSQNIIPRADGSVTGKDPNTAILNSIAPAP